MKKILFMLIAIFGLVGCYNDIIWDYYQYSATFDIVNEDGAHMLDGDENAIYDVEVIYKGKTYTYQEETRATSARAFAIRRTSEPNLFNVGEMYWGSSGSFEIKFRGNSWNVKYETDESSGKRKKDPPVLTSRVWVDDNPPVEGKSIIQLIYVPVAEE